MDQKIGGRLKFKFHNQQLTLLQLHRKLFCLTSVTITLYYPGWWLRFQTLNEFEDLQKDVFSKWNDLFLKIEVDDC